MTTDTGSTWFGAVALIGRPGLLALLERWYCGNQRRSCGSGFPRINAMGRLQTPEPALKLLLTTTGSGGRLAAELDSANRAPR